MSDLYQDITITLDLSEMTPEQYKKILKQLNKISVGQIDTYTYDPDSGSADKLSRKHQKLLKTLIS